MCQGWLRVGEREGFIKQRDHAFPSGSKREEWKEGCLAIKDCHSQEAGRKHVAGGRGGYIYAVSKQGVKGAKHVAKIKMSLQGV